MTKLGTLSKRSHWTIRTAILFHQNISGKVWSIIAAAASLWWSVRHTKIDKSPKVFKISKCSSAPSCELIIWLDSKLIPKWFKIFEFLYKNFLVHPRYLSGPDYPGQFGDSTVCVQWKMNYGTFMNFTLVSDILHVTRVMKL